MDRYRFIGQSVSRLNRSGFITPVVSDIHLSRDMRYSLIVSVFKPTSDVDIFSLDQVPDSKDNFLQLLFSLVGHRTAGLP